MKILTNKKYNELILKPLQGCFAQVDDDMLLRENGLLYAENKKLHSIIKEVKEYILTHKLYCFEYDDEELFEIVTDKKVKDELLKILDKGSEDDEN